MVVLVVTARSVASVWALRGDSPNSPVSGLPEADGEFHSGTGFRFIIVAEFMFALRISFIGCCFYVVALQGLEKTANKNFGGGNTAWEEEKLAKYARR